MSKTIPVLLLVAALFLALGSAQVIAADRGGSVSKGTITLCEQRFDGRDFGDKGYLTIRDFQATYPREAPDTWSKAASRFWAMDTNGDAKVTRDEYCAYKSRT